MSRYQAAIVLIREADVNRLLAEVHRDTNSDHRALTEAFDRYDKARRR